MSNKEKVSEKNVSCPYVPGVCFPDVDLSYNPHRDIAPVSQSDALDLKDAFANGFIPDNVVIGDSDYDNADDPKAIIGRPANEFEAIHMMQSVREAKASVDASNQ